MKVKGRLSPAAARRAQHFWLLYLLTNLIALGADHLRVCWQAEIFSL